MHSDRAAGYWNVGVEAGGAGVFIEVSPPDLNTDVSGFANVPRRSHEPRTTLTLTAPGTFNSLRIGGWEIDGVRLPDGSRTPGTMIAESYGTPGAVYPQRLLTFAPRPRLVNRRHPNAKAWTKRRWRVCARWGTWSEAIAKCGLRSAEGVTHFSLLTSSAIRYS